MHSAISGSDTFTKITGLRVLKCKSVQLYARYATALEQSNILCSLWFFIVSIYPLYVAA